MGNWETFEPLRRGRSAPGVSVRLYIPKAGTPQVRVSREGRSHLGLDKKINDGYDVAERLYVRIEVDLDSGDVRLSASNPAEGRLLNHRNGQFTVGRAFVEWTGWDVDCSWDEYDLSEPGVIVCRGRRVLGAPQAGV